MPSRESRGLAVLVADDEANIRRTLKVCIEAEGARVVEAKSTDDALHALAREPFDLALVDLKLGAESGLDLIPKLLAAQLDLPVVVITAFATIETAVEAMKRGARDYLPKPFTPAQVRHVVATLAERHRTLARVATLEDRLRETAPEVELDSRNATFRAALELALRAAPSDATILIRGETGTGKGVVARAIHGRSDRADRPFLTVSGAALTPDLFASELFGHVQGAFTGATRDQPGKLDAARGGTLFLDEVGELDLSVQAKLLRVIQDKEYERVGETRTRRADVRFVTATNRDLEALVKEGSFREDLLFRLNVIEVKLPALRDRPEDVEALAQAFLRFFARRRPRPLRFAPAAVERLRAHAWPGNVRELKNAIERATILAVGDVVEADLLPGGSAGAPGSFRAGDPLTIEELVDEHVARVIARTSTLEEAAKILGVDRATLWRRRKREDRKS